MDADIETVEKQASANNPASQNSTASAQVSEVGVDDVELTESEMAEHERRKLHLAPTKSLLLQVEEPPEQPPTTYCETLIHLFKGNIGPGLFAMGDAFHNGGILVAPILTILIASICIHCQHVLIKCSKKMAKLRGDDECSDYAETVEQCFESGPKKLQSWSKHMKTMVNIFICVTQLGFCCIYFVFIGTNIKQIFLAADITISSRYIMLVAFIPILLTSLITNLKWLTPVSMIANVCMVTGLGVTLYYALRDGLPDAGERPLYTSPDRLALFFGTAIFAFEGIALVLPLKNSMANPNNFEKLPFGVLNVGMFLVSSLFLFSGAVGYLKWGDEVGGSLTLNLGESILALTVKGLVSTGVLLGYPLQFFIAIQIMWPNVMELLHLNSRPSCGELSFRTFMVLITLTIAVLVPSLGVFISLIGALCSTSLALVFPPMMELLLRDENAKGPGAFVLIKNIIILSFALLGFATGSYESISQIVQKFGQEVDLK